MPIWMGVTTGLHILVSAIAWFYFKSTFPWLFATALIWAIVIPYSLIFPVPLIKESLYVYLGYSDREWSTKLDVASYDLLYLFI